MPCPIPFPRILALATIALLATAGCATTGSGPRASAPGGRPVTVSLDLFGTLPDGTVVTRYTLQNSRGMTARIITYGATLTELLVPDRNDVPGDVVLGFDDLQGYLDRALELFDL